MLGEQAYQNAMKRRAELRQELDEIEQFLQLCEKFAGPRGAAAHMSSEVKAGDSFEASVVRSPGFVSGMDLVLTSAKPYLMLVGHFRAAML